MDESNSVSSEYPQRIYDFLIQPEFREYLFLAYKEAGGNKELFSKDLEDMGPRAVDYLEILFEVAAKEYELQENDDNQNESQAD